MPYYVIVRERVVYDPWSTIPCIIREYVTPPGGKRSFSLDIREAQLYSTMDEAKRDLCPDNEYIVPLLDPLQKRRV